MIHKSIFFLAILVLTQHHLLAMEPKVELARVQIHTPALEPRTPESVKEKDPKRSSIMISLAVDDKTPSEKKPDHKHHGARSDLTSITIASAGPADQSGARGRAMTFSIDMQDIAHAKPEEMEHIVDELIAQASIDVFGKHDEHLFYVPELKAALLQSLKEYVQSTQGAHESGSGTSSSDSSLSEPHAIADLYGSRAIEPREVALTKLRHGVFKRLSSRELVLRRNKEREEPVAGPASGAIESNTQAHRDLKEWFLQELEINNLKMREEQRILKEKAAADKDKLSSEVLKKKYAMIATVVTGAIGLAGSILTYLLTHATQQASN